MRHFVTALVFSVVTAATVGAQAPAPMRATVVTTEDETIEGALFAASESDVVLLVAGQQLKIPTAGIRYISFVGRLDGAPSVEPVASLRPLQAAFKAFEDLKAATEIGMLREQYSEKLQETMPAVRAFVESGPNWPNVRVVLETARRAYSNALADWGTPGSLYMRLGAAWVAYAKQLASAPAEEHHLEEQIERDLPVLQLQTGRLGVGDHNNGGGFYDVYVMDLSVKASVFLIMECSPCSPDLTLLDWSGKQIDVSASGRLGETLPPGKYKVFAGTGPGEVGHYTLIRRGQ